jgi:hypothetical protein
MLRTASDRSAASKRTRDDDDLRKPNRYRTDPTPWVAFDSLAVNSGESDRPLNRWIAVATKPAERDVAQAWPSGKATSARTGDTV